MVPTTKRDTEYKGRREPRPFSPAHALHITMRSELAKGSLSMAHPSHRAWVRYYIPALARNLGIRLYHYANGGSHLHLIVYSKDKKAVSAYLRALSGVIARRMMKAEKGRAKKMRFWLSRPFSRIVSWGRECAPQAHRMEVRSELTKLCKSCIRDERRPFGVGFQEQASNHSKLLRSKAVVVSIGG